MSLPVLRVYASIPCISTPLTSNIHLISLFFFIYTGPWRLLRCDRVYEPRVQQDQGRRGGGGEGEREAGTYLYESCI